MASLRTTAVKNKRREVLKARLGGLDKYYTKQYIADYYSHIVYEMFGDLKYIEPCAGAGAFLKVLPDIKGYDIAPEGEDIEQSDVFELDFNQSQVVVSNPPYGVNSTLAVKIFNRIAEFAVKAICLVVPKTFKKDSIQNQLNLNYHLKFEQDIIKDAFTVEGKSVDVPSVFQIWVYSDKERSVKESEDCKWFEFTTKENADIAVRRAGGKAGQLLEGLDHTESSTYFIKTLHKDVVKAIKLIDKKVVENTAGVKSISKQELICEVNRIMRVLNES